VTTITNIAQTILNENGYEVDDLSPLTLTILENKIDDAIDYVNLMAGTSITELDGTAGTKSFIYVKGENVPVKQLVNLMLKAYKEKGTQGGLGPLNVSYVQANPDYHLSWMLVEKSIERLQKQTASGSPPIFVSNDPVPT
jgi:hypothetical protein